MDNTEFSTTENHCGGSGSEKLGGMCSNPPAPPAPAPRRTPTAKTETNVPLELHVCMGLNACKGHDRFGTNDCAGTGFCATASVHHCRTLNDCRGSGRLWIIRHGGRRRDTRRKRMRVAGRVRRPDSGGTL